MLIDTPPRAEELWPSNARWPRRRSDALLGRFQAAFPTISYDISWTSDTVNAQAFILGEQRCVRLYGGLARHRRVGMAGLAFALAHETGHHVAGPPHHPLYFWLSSEERASEWALEQGLPRVFRHACVGAIGRKGSLQLSALRDGFQSPIFGVV
jgi:hypothetical protein